ncbi:SCO5918 family protein [Streptomyces sp. NPDC051921]|uniref:SCO5918 family protein n=1 Tax=Streptomyces sp. NPDC051921 TaxID=3155806 RepID=UPI003435BAA4
MPEFLDTHRIKEGPVKQVGEVITRQDRRDFTAGEALRAMTKLGFTCRGLPRPPAPLRASDALQHASALLGAPTGT